MSNPKIIYSEQTGTEYVEIVEDGEFRWFTFGDDIPQGVMSLVSPTELVSPYVQGMVLALVFVSDVHRVLLIGLGGGSMARFLRRYFPSVSLSAIEASAPVINLARQYFFLPEEGEGFRVYCADAEEMLRLKRRPKEIIFVDIPCQRQPVLASENFFKHCYGRFQEQGIFVTHVCCETKEAQKNYLSLLGSVFTGGIWCIPLKDFDEIVFAFKKAPSSMRSYQKAAERLKRKTGVDFPEWLRKIERL